MAASVEDPEDLRKHLFGSGSLALPPRRGEWSVRQRYAAACGLGILAALLNIIAVPLLSEETPEFLFGGACVLLAFVLFGTGPGLLAAAIGAIPQVVQILPDVPALAIAYLVYPLEALVAYRLWRRFGSLVLAVSVFWFGIGWLCDLVGYHWLVGIAGTYVVLLFIKQLLNGVLNALIAEVALRIPAISRRARRPVRLRQFVFGGIVAVVMAPGLMLAILFTRATYSRHVAAAQTQSELTASTVQLELSNWVAGHQHRLVRLAREVEVPAPGSDTTTLSARLAISEPGLAPARLADLPRPHPCGPADAIANWERATGPAGDTIVVARQALQENGTCRRAVELLIPAGDLDRLLAGAPGERVSLFDDRGRVLASQDPDRRAGATETPPPGMLSDKRRHFTYYSPESGSAEAALDVDLRYATVSRLRQPPWILLVDLPSSSLHDAMTPAVAQLLLYFLLLLLLLYAAVSFFSTQVTRPIVAINRAVREIAAGPLEDNSAGAALPTDLARHPILEVRSLATHFADMQRALIYRDALTGLPNRARFLAQMRADAELVARRAGAPAALLQVGIDRFRALNELLGSRDAGALLVAFARRLQSAAGESAWVARVNEHEFALLLPAGADSTAALHHSEALLAVLRRPYLVNGRSVTVTASAGVLLYTGGELGAEPMLERAAAAMRTAQQQGGDSLCLFSAEIDLRVREHQLLEDALRRALAVNETRAVYQPIVRAADGALRSLEALARWPSEPLLSAGTERIIQLAEERDLVAGIDDAVLRIAAAQHARWRDRAKDLVLSVNLSPRRLQRSDLAERIIRTLGETGLAPHRLELEITEGAVLLDFEQSLQTLGRLRDAGVRIALDDFGTGYSSLRYLQRLPVDTVKIDRAFVRGLSTGLGDAAITRAILALAHSLRLEVVAEGVETAEQLAALQALGCDYVQGFLISPPLCPEEVEAVLGQRWLPVAVAS